MCTKQAVGLQPGLQENGFGCSVVLADLMGDCPGGAKWTRRAGGCSRTVLLKHKNGPFQSVGL